MPVKIAKNSDFKVSKSRAGKSQYRSSKSSDDKLLNNLNRVKKTVKLSTQSITVNKDNLNITSRRLTLAELIGKSRHSSINVRRHSLMSLIEFIRRYEDEGRLNLCLILQVASSNLIHESNIIREYAKKLLQLIILTYLNNEKYNDNKHLECLYLHLVQGVLSSNEQLANDIYLVINLIIDKYPWILYDYSTLLLSKIISNVPNYTCFNHLNCVYLLFKLKRDENTSHNFPSGHESNTRNKFNTTFADDNNTLGEKIINYSIEVIQHVTSSQDEDSNQSIEAEELKCLTVASSIVKGLKLLYYNTSLIKPNDARLIEILSTTDLYEYEKLTVKGKETYDVLYAEFIFTRVELALHLLYTFSKCQFVLLNPLIQLESIKHELSHHHNRIARVLYIAITRSKGLNVCKEWLNGSITCKNLKHRWISYLISSLSQSKLPELNNIKTWLQDIFKFIKIKSNSFNALDDVGDNSINGVKYKECTYDLIYIYNIIILSLFKSIINSPCILPLISLYKGLLPNYFIEIFKNTTTHWQYLWGLDLNVDVIININLNFDEILYNFLSKQSPNTTCYLKLLLYISRNPSNLGPILMEFILKTFKYNKIENLHHTSTPEVQSTSSPLAVPPEVTSTVGRLADSSSNYLSLKSIATPGDRGEESETIHGSRGEINREATTASGKEVVTSGGEAVYKTTSYGMDSGTATLGAHTMDELLVYNNEQCKLLCRILLNVDSSKVVIDRIMAILDVVMDDEDVFMGYFNVLVHHIFNIDVGKGIGSSRIDVCGRVILGIDILSTSIERFNYCMDIIINLIKIKSDEFISKLMGLIIDKFLYKLNSSYTNYKLNDIIKTLNDNLIEKSSNNSRLMKIFKESKFYTNEFNDSTVVHST